VSRPALEAADIFGGHEAAWRDANAEHVSLDQLKVMSAIERCQMAALGGHVALLRVGPLQDHDARHRRALPDPRPAQWLASHPSLRAACERMLPSHRCALDTTVAPHYVRPARAINEATMSNQLKRTAMDLFEGLRRQVGLRHALLRPLMRGVIEDLFCAPEFTCETIFGISSDNIAYACVILGEEFYDTDDLGNAPYLCELPSSDSERLAGFIANVYFRAAGLLDSKKYQPMARKKKRPYIINARRIVSAPEYAYLFDRSFTRMVQP